MHVKRKLLNNQHLHNMAYTCILVLLHGDTDNIIPLLFKYVANFMDSEQIGFAFIKFIDMNIV